MDSGPAIDRGSVWTSILKLANRSECCGGDKCAFHHLLCTVTFRQLLQGSDFGERGSAEEPQVNDTARLGSTLASSPSMASLIEESSSESAGFRTFSVSNEAQSSAAIIPRKVSDRKSAYRLATSILSTFCHRCVNFFLI